MTVVSSSAPTRLPVCRKRFVLHEDVLQPGDDVGGGDKLRDDLQPVRKHGDREGGAAQKQHAHVRDLNQDHALLHGVHDRRDNQPDRPDGDQAEHDEKEQCRHICGHVHSVTEVGQPQRDQARAAGRPAGQSPWMRPATAAAKSARLCSGAGYCSRAPARRACPPPNRPLPRMPITSTMVITCTMAPPRSAWLTCANRKKKPAASGN